VNRTGSVCLINRGSPVFILISHFPSLSNLTFRERSSLLSLVSLLLLRSDGRFRCSGRWAQAAVPPCRKLEFIVFLFFFAFFFSRSPLFYYTLKVPKKLQPNPRSTKTEREREKKKLPLLFLVHGRMCCVLLCWSWMVLSVCFWWIFRQCCGRVVRDLVRFWMKKMDPFVCCATAVVCVCVCLWYPCVLYNCVFSVGL